MRSRGRSAAGLSPERTSWLKDEIQAISTRLGPGASDRRIYAELVTQHERFCKEIWDADLPGQLKFIRENRGEPSRAQVRRRASIARAKEVRERIGEERATAQARAELDTIRAVEIPAREDQARAIGQLGAIRAEKEKLADWQETVDQRNWREYELLEERYLRWKDRVWPVFAMLTVIGWGAVIMWSVWSSQMANPLVFGFPPSTLFGLPTLDVLVLFSAVATGVLVLFFATIGIFSRASARIGESHARYGRDAWLLNRVRSGLESAEFEAERNAPR